MPDVDIEKLKHIHYVLRRSDRPSEATHALSGVIEALTGICSWCSGFGKDYCGNDCDACCGKGTK